MLGQAWLQYNKMLLKIISIFFFISFVLTLIDPSLIISHFKKILPQELSLLTMDLGRTINGRTILAYGLTKIPELKDNPQLYQKVPSTLLVSYLHGPDQHTVDLILSYLTSAVLNFKNDYYLSYLLESGMLWFVPFLNVDMYEEFVRTQKVQKIGTELFSKYNKNWHLYPTDKHRELCDQQFLNGVNIDYNFMVKENNTAHPCEADYAGPSPFSEGEAKAIKKIFGQLAIKNVIIFQSVGNKWLYPDNAIENQHGYLDYLYNDIANRLRQSNYLVEKNINQLKGILQWSASQGALTFTHFVGDKYLMSKEEVEPLFKRSFPVIDMLIKKVCPIYQKYRYHNTLLIQSLSVQPFQVRIQLSIQSEGFLNKKSYILKPCGNIQIEIDPYMHKFLDQLAINVTILDTLITQSIKVLEVQENAEAIQNIKQFNDRLQKSKEQNYSWIRILKMLALGVCLVRIGYYILKRISRSKKLSHHNDEEKARLFERN